jgi:hypothetical protein
MAGKLNPNEIIDLQKLLMSGIIQREALINLLDRKGIIARQELLEEMKSMQASIQRSPK